jgi:hypothetical protein
VNLSETFRSISAPETERHALQLTSGPAFCYPFYYFIPSITEDRRFMVYHRETPGTPNDIQLWRLDLGTGEHVQLTAAPTPEADWKPWGVDPARGVSGDRGALAPARGEVVYFQGNAAFRVGLDTLEHHRLFELPSDRFPLSQNCVTGNGEWFVYAHVDREAYWRLLEARLLDGAAFRARAHECEATQICAYNLDSGINRVVFRLNYPVHHLHPYRNRYVAFSHIPGDRYGMGFFDVEGSWYSIPRPQDDHGGKIIHHVPTERGIAYEVKHRSDDNWVGFIDPLEDARVEWTVPFQASHTGCDPSGRRFFYHAGDGSIQSLVERQDDGVCRFTPICGRWPIYGKGQKSHYHPRIVLGGGWMQMVAGDPQTETNHVFLVDVERVPLTGGVDFGTIRRGGTYE